MMNDNELVYPYAYDISSILGGNCCNVRTERICRITPHHVAGVVHGKAQAESICRNWISRKASANYIIDVDGNVYCALRNDKRAWTSSNRDNDMKAVTFEMSNSAAKYPWPISDKTYLASVRLSAWVCDTFGVTPNYNGSATVSASITTHRMFAATQCPGDYFVQTFLNTGQYVQDIKDAMQGSYQTVIESPKADIPIWYIQIGAYKVQGNAIRQAATLDGYTVVHKDGGLYYVRKPVLEGDLETELATARAKYPKAFARKYE